MAESQNLGKLVVQMLLDPTQWQTGVNAVQASAKALVSGIQRAAAVVSGTLAPALDAVSDGAEGMGKSVQDTANTLDDKLNPSLGETAQSAEDASDKVHSLAGVVVDANGKLRDATGKFVKAEDALKGLGDTAGLTEDEIKHLQDAVDKAAFDRASKSAKTLIENFKSLADTASHAVVRGLQAATLAAGAFAAASAVVGINFEQQMQKVGVIAGATEEQMAALTAEARRLGATTAFSGTEAAQAMEVLASAGLNTEQIIAATGQAMVLAGAGGTDLALSAEIVASTLSQFSLQANQAGRIADVFAQATAESQFQVDDLGEALKYGGPVAASFGLSLEETVAIMAQFRDLGLQGSMAGTALRSVFSQASQQTKINADTLAKYNLQLSQVNPQLHSFSEILAVVGQAGMSAADAMVVFGVEAGGAVATMAQQAALGSTKLDDMTASLNAAAAEGGAATEMYAQMQQTVAGALAELQSASEEVLLTLYAQYGAGLGALLAQITAFVNEVAVAIGERANDIRGSLGAAMAILGDYADEHGGDLAAMFADAVAKVAEFTVGLAKVATMFADLIPVLDDIVLTMGLVWVATQVAAFVSALGEVVSVLGAAKLGLRAFMVELTVASGGTYALVAAIGVLVAGLVTLIGRYNDATDAAEQLKAAQDALKGKRTDEDKARIEALDAILMRQKEGLAAQRTELAASGKLTEAKRAELDLLQGLTAESAARLEADGKLVEVNGELHTVANLVATANEDASDAAVEGYNAIEDRVQALRASAQATDKDIAAVEAAMGRVKQAGENATDTTTRMILSNALGEEINTLTEAEAKIEDLKIRRREATNQAVALETERAKATDTILTREAENIKGLEADRLRDKGIAVASIMREEGKYTDQTRNIRWKLQQETAGMETLLTDQIGQEMKARRREIDQAYADQKEKAKGKTAELLRLEQDYQGALTDLEALEAKKRAAAWLEVEQARRKAALDERERLKDKIKAMEMEGLKDSERLEREKADAIAGITGANVDLLLEIAEGYDKKIAAAREQELADEQAAADALAEHHKENAKKVATAMVGAFSAAASAIGSALESVYGLFESFASAVLDVFATMTGFSFDLASLVSDTQTAQDAAADEGTTLSAGDAAASVVSDLFAEASTFLALFADAGPALIKGLGAGLGELIDQFLAAVPTLAAAVLAEAPTIVQTIADALPGLVQVVVGLLPDVAEALLGVVDIVVPAVLAVLPDLLDGLVTTASAFVQGVIQRLPDILRGLLDLLPGLIQGVLGELPTLIRGLLAAATDVILALLDALPELVGAILDALPDILVALIEGLVEALPVIIEALIEALPPLLLAIIGAVPDIISAVVGELPTIITMLIALVPTLIEGVAAALPQLIPALIGMSGEIATALVMAIPEIAAALFWGVLDLITSLPDLAQAIGQAFVDGIKGAAEAIWDALSSIFTGLWDALFGGDDSSSKSSKSRSASSGRTSLGSLAELLDLSAGVRRLPEVERMDAQETAQRRPAAGTSGQGSTARVQVMLNGRTVQDVLAVSDARGETTFKSKQSSGAGHVGVSRGRYNRYSK